MSDEASEVVSQEVSQETTQEAPTDAVTEQSQAEAPTQGTGEEVTPEATAEPEHPEWFMKDKYKSIEEQARSAYELQKKMGKNWGAPSEDYTLEGIEGVSKDDPLVANLMPALKDIGLSQEGFKNLVTQYQEANVKMMKSFEEQLKKELTQEDAATYNDVDKWMTENLTAEEKATIQNGWLMSGKDFKLFNQLRLMAAPSTSVPSSTTNEGARFESSAEVENDKIKYRKEVKQKLRVPDSNYENELARRFRDAKGRELRGR
jgi:hypothetical protein